MVEGPDVCDSWCNGGHNDAGLPLATSEETNCQMIPFVCDGIINKVTYGILK